MCPTHSATPSLIPFARASLDFTARQVHAARASVKLSSAQRTISRVLTYVPAETASQRRGPLVAKAEQAKSISRLSSATFVYDRSESVLCPSVDRLPLTKAEVRNSPGRKVWDFFVWNFLGFLCRRVCKRSAVFRTEVPVGKFS